MNGILQWRSKIHTPFKSKFSDNSPKARFTHTGQRSRFLCVVWTLWFAMCSIFATFVWSSTFFVFSAKRCWKFNLCVLFSSVGAFLIPYVLMLIFVGIPIFFFELSFGQFASLGPITIWNAIPLFRGTNILTLESFFRSFTSQKMLSHWRIKAPVCFWLCPPPPSFAGRVIHEYAMVRCCRLRVWFWW